MRGSNGNQLYPELGLGFNVDSFQGLNAKASDTVSLRAEVPGTAEANRVKFIMGDYTAFEWGVARYLPLETIEFGDPDGQGDLKRTNEIAIRAEAAIGFVFFDPSAFAVLQKTS